VNPAWTFPPEFAGADGQPARISQHRHDCRNGKKKSPAQKVRRRKNNIVPGDRHEEGQHGPLTNGRFLVVGTHHDYGSGRILTLVAIPVVKSSVQYISRAFGGFQRHRRKRTRSGREFSLADLFAHSRMKKNEVGRAVKGKVAILILGLSNGRVEKCRGASLRGQGTPALSCPPPQ
jgi:hypothetical protein